MFERELRDLSHVPRWVMVRVMRRQSVAEHLFYTAIYADTIARACNGIDVQRVVRAALWHDAEECFTGDIPGPTKRDLKHGEWDKVIEKAMDDRFADWRADISSDEQAVLKAAGLLDEVMYLAAEIQMGNGAVGKIFEYCRGRLAEAWRNLPMGEVGRLKLWAEAVVPAILREVSGYSTLQANNSDLNEGKRKAAAGQI